MRVVRGYLGAYRWDRRILAWEIYNFWHWRSATSVLGRQTVRLPSVAHSARIDMESLLSGAWTGKF